MRTVRAMASGAALTAVLSAAGLFLGGQAAAAVIDMEEIALTGGFTTENGSTRTFNGFDVFVPAGHYMDSDFVRPASAPRVGNGSDYLLHDHASAVRISRSGGGVFSASSIDVSEYLSGYGSENTLMITGFHQGGGATVLDLTTDASFGFETFAFSLSNLVGLEIARSSGGYWLAYDNIVVNHRPPIVPVPAALPLFASALAGLGVVSWRRRKAA